MSKTRFDFNGHAIERTAIIIIIIVVVVIILVVIIGDTVVFINKLSIGRIKKEVVFLRYDKWGFIDRFRMVSACEAFFTVLVELQKKFFLVCMPLATVSLLFFTKKFFHVAFGKYSEYYRVHFAGLCVRILARGG